MIGQALRALCRLLRPPSARTTDALFDQAMAEAEVRRREAARRASTVIGQGATRRRGTQASASG